MNVSYKAAQIARLNEQTKEINEKVDHLKADAGADLDAVIQSFIDNSDQKITYKEARLKVCADPRHSDLVRRYLASFPNAEAKRLA